MAENKNKKDRLHEQMNPYFNTRHNPNWKVLLDTIGESDQNIADLIYEVRKQFFINTSSRPYIDRLASNLNVSRPKVVGMDDTTMRRYVPILAYQPKQVKLIMDQLLDVFFFREATTAFLETTVPEPYFIKDGWELSYKVDIDKDEKITFPAEAFTDATQAKAEEIVSILNRQAKYSFAVVFDNRIEKKKYVRIFTKTVGSKGSIEINGGRANISLQSNGLILGAGSLNTTVWGIQKVGDTTTFTCTGGDNPNLNLVQAGDIAIIDIPGNSGSFVVQSVDLFAGSFSFENLFSTQGAFSHLDNPGYYVRFFRPERSVIYTRNNRSMVWEVSSGEIIIEMPATPPVVRRGLKGSAHINGLSKIMTNVNSETSIDIEDASEWPNSGWFAIEPTEEVQTHMVTPTEDYVSTQTIFGRFDIAGRRHSYTSKVGNTLNGISPPIPQVSGVYELDIANISKDSDSVVTVDLVNPFPLHNDYIRIYDTGGISLDGTFEITEVISSTRFKYMNLGPVETATTGKVRIERIGLKNSGSIVHLTTARINTGIFGPTLWDTRAPFILSSYTCKSETDIKAGNIILNLQVTTPNSIPNERGFLIFDYGLETQEGPVRYMYKASDAIIAVDPSYVFQYDHGVGSTITAIRRKGAHVMSGNGTEYAFYTADPSAARKVLQELIKEVKSVGTFLKFIVRYPVNYYSEFDLYAATDDPLD
jgi:hypothetical protein